MFQKFLDLLFRDSQLKVYAGELEVRPRAAPTMAATDVLPRRRAQLTLIWRTDAAHERAAQGLICALIRHQQVVSSSLTAGCRILWKTPNINESRQRLTAI